VAGFPEGEAVARSADGHGGGAYGQRFVDVKVDHDRTIMKRNGMKWNRAEGLQ
jgi:hypothetical protein